MFSCLKHQFTGCSFFWSINYSNRIQRTAPGDAHTGAGSSRQTKHQRHRVTPPDKRWAGAKPSDFTTAALSQAPNIPERLSSASRHHNKHSAAEPQSSTNTSALNLIWEIQCLIVVFAARCAAEATGSDFKWFLEPDVSPPASVGITRRLLSALTSLLKNMQMQEKQKSAELCRFGRVETFHQELWRNNHHIQSSVSAPTELGATNFELLDGADNDF